MSSTRMTEPSFFHGRDGVLEDHSALLVGVVVEDVAHVVERGAWFERGQLVTAQGRLGRREDETVVTFDGLRLEKSCDIISTLSFVDGVGQRLRDVLQYHPALEARKAFSKSNALLAQTSAHIDEEWLLWAPGFEPSPPPGTRLARWACDGAGLPSSG